MATRKTATKTTARKTASTKKKAAPKKRKAASSAKDPKESAATIDRRRKPRRTKEEEAAADEQPQQPEAPMEETPKLERRKKVNRRRQIDPTTCERDYSDAEVEFMNALDDYKRTSGRMFPTCSEVLEVIRGLGYVQLSAAELATRDAGADQQPGDDLEADAEAEALAATELSDELQTPVEEEAIV